MLCCVLSVYDWFEWFCSRLFEVDRRIFIFVDLCDDGNIVAANNLQADHHLLNTLTRTVHTLMTLI